MNLDIVFAKDSATVLHLVYSHQKTAALENTGWTLPHDQQTHGRLYTSCAVVILTDQKTFEICSRIDRDKE